MTHIGLISDTHGLFDKKFKDFFQDCDKVLHAGDIGNIDTYREMESFKPVRAVYGNIDGTDIRSFIPEIQDFTIESMRILMIHIGGYPGKYDPRIKNQIQTKPPDIFISGHSHILKVIPDKKLKLLHLNPGAAGKSGFHKVRTAMRFVIDDKKINDLEIMELKRH